MSLYFISIGLSDEKDMSLKALEAAKSCDLLFAEFYTTKLNTTKEKLEKLIGKEIKILSRADLEENYQKVLDEARVKKVGLLVGGDAFIATTHSALALEAKKQGIEVKVIHGSSIISAIAETGLHIYKFGAIVTIPFPERTKGKLPISVYNTIKENLERGLHTLCLLDIDIEKNKFMSVNEAVTILIELEKKLGSGILRFDKKVVAFSKAGSDQQVIIYDTLDSLREKDFEKPAVIIIPGKLHFTEKEFLENLKNI
jgi:diphthine synthase